MADKEHVFEDELHVLEEPFDAADPDKSGSSESGQARVVVVTHRVTLPAELRKSPVELDVALHGALRGRPVLWFGWSGKYGAGPSTEPRISQRGMMTRARIDLPRADHEGFNSGYARGALWPLFHYRPTAVEFAHSDYLAYMRINEEYARHLLPMLRPDDLIWVHGLHLMPLAQCLRALGAKQRIGYFHHIPFPSPDILTTLPAHESLLRALAEFDLVGFNAGTDVASFSRYFASEHGAAMDASGAITVFGRRFRVAAFPVGIDVDAVASLAEWATESAKPRELRDQLAGRKLIIGVDDLDRSKGLLRRFKAIETLLEDHPEWRNGATTLQIALPAGHSSPDSRRLRPEIQAAVEQINRRFGTEGHQPARCVFRLPARETLFGCLRLGAVGLATPLRDGMNLTAKEFVACQNPEDPGIPILSRFVGAAKQLDAALIVNPYDVSATAEAIHRALTMPLRERLDRHRDLMAAVRGYDIHRWRESFLSALADTGASPDRFDGRDQGGARSINAA
jgi:trehalose 6-phosphate synthase